MNEKRRAKERFALATRLEKEYSRQLRMVTRQIDRMVKSMVDKGVVRSDELVKMLNQYGEIITPWAKVTAEKMILRIAKKDESNWVRLSREIGKTLHKQLQDAPVENELVQFLETQVSLIKSLPIEAAQRVHLLTLEGLATGRRADHIAKEILETGKITENRAKLIARTEVARTASGLTMARAKHVGSTHYYWRTSGDGDVRSTHKAMNGKIVEWDNPPEVDPGKFYHAGQFPNCRCYPEPIIDDI